MTAMTLAAALLSLTDARCYRPVLAAHFLELEVQNLAELRLRQRQKGHHLCVV